MGLRHPIATARRRWFTDIAHRRDVNVRGHDISLAITNAVDLFRADTYATKEPETLDWIDRYVQQGDVFFDVGANVGVYSLYAAKARQARVYAFEPEAANAGQLQRNIVLNGLRDLISPVVTAIADKEGFDTLHLNGAHVGPAYALHAFGTAVDFAGRTFQPIATQGVYGVTLDALVQRHGYPMPRHIKIDVDGLEPKIISGARDTLRNPELRSLLVEIEDVNAGVGADIQAFGFQIVATRQVSVSGKVAGANCVFARLV